MKKLVTLCVEGAKILDICVEGDKLIEEGTGAVYNKSVKGVKVPKGTSNLSYASLYLTDRIIIFLYVILAFFVSIDGNIQASGSPHVYP